MSDYLIVHSLAEAKRLGYLDLISKVGFWVVGLFVIVFGIIYFCMLNVFFIVNDPFSNFMGKIFRHFWTFSYTILKNKKQPFVKPKQLNLPLHPTRLLALRMDDKRN